MQSLPRLLQRTVKTLSGPGLASSLLVPQKALLVLLQSRRLQAFQVSAQGLTSKFSLDCESQLSALCYLQEGPLRILFAEGSVLRTVSLEGKIGWTWDTSYAEMVRTLEAQGGKVYVSCEHVLGVVDVGTRPSEEWHYMAEQRINAVWPCAAEGRVYLATNSPVLTLLVQGKAEKVTLKAPAVKIVAPLNSPFLVLPLRNGRIALYNRTTKEVRYVGSGSPVSGATLGQTGLMLSREDNSVQLYECDSRSLTLGELPLLWSKRFDQRISGVHQALLGRVVIVVTASGKVIYLDDPQQALKDEQQKDLLRLQAETQDNEQAIDQLEQEIELASAQLSKCKQRQQKAALSSCVLQADPEQCAVVLRVHCESLVEQLQLEAECSLDVLPSPEYSVRFNSENKALLVVTAESTQVEVRLKARYKEFGPVRCLVFTGARPQSSSLLEFELRALPFYSRSTKEHLQETLGGKLSCVLEARGEFSRGDVLAWLGTLFTDPLKLTEERVDVVLHDERTGSFLHCEGGAKKVVFRSNSLCDLAVVRRQLARKMRQRSAPLSCEVKGSLDDLKEQILAVGEGLILFEEVERRRALLPAIKELQLQKESLAPEWEELLGNEAAVMADSAGRRGSYLWLKEYLRELVRSHWEERERRSEPALERDLELALHPFNSDSLFGLLAK